MRTYNLHVSAGAGDQLDNDSLIICQLQADPQGKR